MKTLNYIIVEVDEPYKNSVTLSGRDIIVNSSIENVDNINRVVNVISAPKNTIIKKGDKLIIHHNILRQSNSVSGARINSKFHIKDKLYFVPLTEVFMYKRYGEWKAIEPYCFIKPIRKEKEVFNNIEQSTSESRNNSHKGMKKLRGILTYPNERLIQLGALKDAEIIFSNDSEYEFNIEGELYYKMSTNDILAQVE